MLALSIRDLSLTYVSDAGEVSALSNLSLSVEAGAIYALCGPSGGGKSSLLGAIAGILPYEGEVLLGGERPSPREHHIALVPQSYGLLPWMTARDNIALPRRLGKPMMPEAETLAVAQTLGIADLLDKYPHQLSGGQCQRVALARAFGTKPDLLLLDEPFSALDVATAERSRELFLSLWKQYPTTTLIVTHSPHEAASLASRTIVLSQTIVADLDNPTEADILQYLQAYDHD